MTSVKKKKSPHRFIKLDPYTMRLLEKLHEQLKDQTKASGDPVPKFDGLINGCVRTAIHTVYGQDYLYEELMSEKTFREAMTAVGLGPTAEDEEE